MIIEIFDIYNISEFYSSIDGWFKIIVTAILSGIVAFFAARFQIQNQKRHEIEIHHRNNETKRDIIFDNVNEAIKKVQIDSSSIEEYKNIIVQHHKEILINHFTNPPIKILLSFSYKELFEIFKYKIDISDSGNIKGIRELYSATLMINDIYETILDDINEYFKQNENLSYAIEKGNENILMTIKQMPYDSNNTTDVSTVFYEALNNIGYSFFDSLEKNEKQTHKKESHEIYEAFYWTLIKEMNKNEYKNLNNFEFRKSIIAEVEKIRHLNTFERSVIKKLENRVGILSQCKYHLERFMRVFK